MARRPWWRAPLAALGFADPGEFKIEPMEPKRALAFFRAKTVGTRFSFNWQDVWQEEHAAAFVAARAMRTDVLQILHRTLERAMAEGWTVERYVNEARPRLKEAGWWGEGLVMDPVTGERETARLGTPRRLRTIFRTNVNMALAAGQWETIEETKEAFPYLEYADTGDERVRDSHRALDGIVLPVDHPFWDTNYPPNDWGCRCDVIQRSEASLQRRGLKVTSDRQIGTIQKNGKRRFRNARTGEVSDVAAGTSPGFSYNVGKSRLQHIRPHYLNESPIGEVDDAPPARAPGGGELAFPEPTPLSEADLGPPDTDATLAYSRFFEALPRQLYFDKAGVPVHINDAVFRKRARTDGTTPALKIAKRGRERFTRQLAQTVTDPDEIWHHNFSGRDGEPRAVRIYTRLWTLGDEELATTVMYDLTRNGLWGETAFQSDLSKKVDNRRRYFERRVRMGTLVYKKK